MNDVLKFIRTFTFGGGTGCMFSLSASSSRGNVFEVVGLVLLVVSFTITLVIDQKLEAKIRRYESGR